MNDPLATAARAAYLGDAALDRLLRQAQARLDSGGVRDLVQGVAAAPEPLDPEAWMVLVADAPGPDLRAQLAALKAQVAVAPREAPWSPARVEAVRAELARRGLAGFIQPRGDEHQGEYVSPRSERLAWLTGFRGSAGLAIVLADRAAIFVDGRYTLQVRAQVDVAVFEPRHLTDEPPADWLGRHAPKGGRIGYDPWLHTEDGLTRLRAACRRAGAELVAVDSNPVDAAWPKQPPPPISPLVPYDVRYAGRDSADKRAEIARKLVADGFGAAVLSAPDSVAWLLNVRGGDVPHTPLALSFALVRADGAVDLFVDPRKLAPGVNAHLGNAVRVRAPDELGPALDALGAEKARVLADQATTGAWITSRLEKAGAEVVRGQDPCALPKACKNEGELANIRVAHRRDGAALSTFLAWVAREGPRGKVTELEAMDRLFEIRRRGENFRDLSFTTISGAGPNGAIVHYRSTPETDRPLAPPMLYLVDSGAQYLDGTTDVTRTVAIGPPTPEQRDRFTRVLKGHIALARQLFPEGTTGSQLDTLARRALWDAGLDFDHGTGHGVGSYLGVHEGPHRIAKVPNTVALKPGMIVSNEPGYYKTGAYGIRIENLVAVRKVDPPPGAERPMLGFETLTLAPIDLALVEPALLTGDEIAWLDAYHARVREALAPRLDAETAAWLGEATRPLPAS